MRVKGNWIAIRCFGILVLLLLAAVVLPCQAELYVNVTNAPYNATPGGGDDSDAFRRALYDLKDEGGVLFIPAGNYIFDSIVTITSEVWSLTIEGEVTTNNKVNLYCRNGDGIFDFPSVSTAHKQFTIRNLTFVADNGGASAGTALNVSCSESGVKPWRSLTAENITVRGGNTAPAYFDYGVLAKNVSRPIFRDCSFIGAVDENDVSDSSDNFLAKAGFDVTGSYASVFEGCSAAGVSNGFRMVSGVTANTEDGAFRNCTTDYCRDGIRFEMAGDWREPSLWVSECDITARDCGLSIKGRRTFQVTDNTFRSLSSSSKLTDVKLDDTCVGLVINNTFLEESPSGRINVEVFCSVTNHFLSNPSLLLSGNSYSSDVDEPVQTETGVALTQN